MSAATGLLVLAIALAAVAPDLARPHRHRAALAAAVMATAAANAALSFFDHALAVELLALGTGVALLYAVHRWAAGFRPTRIHRNESEPHDDKGWR